MPSPLGRGAQVRLDGTAQAAARGALGLPLPMTMEAKRVLEFTGAVAAGDTRDGSTRLGTAAEDEVLAPGGILDAVNNAALLANYEARIAALEGLVASLVSGAAVSVISFQDGSAITFQDGSPVLFQ